MASIYFSKLIGSVSVGFTIMAVWLAASRIFTAIFGTSVVATTANGRRFKPTGVGWIILLVAIPVGFMLAVNVRDERYLYVRFKDYMDRKSGKKEDLIPYEQVVAATSEVRKMAADLELRRKALNVKDATALAAFNHDVGIYEWKNQAAKDLLDRCNAQRQFQADLSKKLVGSWKYKYRHVTKCGEELDMLHATATYNADGTFHIEASMVDSHSNEETVLETRGTWLIKDNWFVGTTNWSSRPDTTPDHGVERFQILEITDDAFRYTDLNGEHFTKYRVNEKQL
jgi:hypothetical protein